MCVSHISPGSGAVEAIHDIRFGFGTFREPAFDSRPSFGIGLPRRVSDRLLELPVLPLLSVPHNSSLAIDSAELSRLTGGGRNRYAGFNTVVANVSDERI